MLTSWKSRFGVLAVIVLAVLAVVSVYVWQQRSALAERVIARVLDDRGIAPVSFHVGFIGFRSISLSGIEVGPAGNRDAVADGVTITYSLGELLSGQVRSIEIEKTSLRVRLGQDGVSLGALDAVLAGGGEGGAFTLPPIDVKNALVTLETPQGAFMVSGPLNISPRNGEIFASSPALQVAEAAPSPRFTPLLLAGQISVAERLYSFEGDVSSHTEDLGEVPVLHATGQYNGETGRGQASGEGHLSFARDGLTPAALLPMLEPPFFEPDGGVGYRAHAEFAPGEIRVAVTADLDRLALRQTAAGPLAFSGALKMSKTFGARADEDAYTIELPALRVDDLTSPQRFAPVTLEGHADFLAPSLSADLVARSAVPVIRGARLGNLSARYDLDQKRGTFEAAGALTMEPGKIEPQTLLPVLKGVMTQVSGKLGYRAAATLREGRLTSSGEVDLANVGFVASVATVAGLDGKVKLASLLPPLTRGVQVVKVKTLQAGVPLENGVVAFNLDEKGLQVVDAAWPFAEGKLTLVSSGSAITTSNAEFVLDVDGVDLSALLKLADVPGLSATGRISGTVPVAIRNGDPVLLDGKLAAESGGLIVYKGSVADAAHDNQTKLLTDALSNFHYTELSGGLSGNANGNLALRLALRGANPDLYDGYPFAINVKLEGSLADMLRRGTVGFRPLEIIKEQSTPAAPPSAGKKEP
ncbi:MAG: YdbH domain-containing protein [Parvibaculum sp.]|nr:YdbH domain-containing protein [Parvibaculum sp.]